jgi:predicted anti-sigma-YlaC factor YlaD
MDCAGANEAMSADLDHELGDLESRALAAHLAGCASCRASHRALLELHRAVRVRPADDVPDLVGPIMAAVELHVERRRHDLEWSRYALLAVALTQLVLALPAVLLGEDGGASIHVARELGSFDVALAAGLLLAAWQPRRAAGLLPFALALAAMIGVTAVADLVSGRAGFDGEAHHVLDLAGVAVLWLVTRIPAAPPDLRRRVQLA